MSSLTRASLLLLFCVSTLWSSAVPNRDSLFNSLEKTTDHHQKALLWKALFKHYSNTRNDSALWAIRNGYREISKSNAEEDRITITNNLGYAFIARNEWDSSLLYLTQAEEAAKKLDSKEKLSAVYFNFGTLYKAQNDFARSVVFLQKAAAIARFTNSDKLFDVLNSLAGSFYYDNQMDSALIYFKQAAQVALINQEPDQYATIYMNLGVMYDITGVSDSALTYYKRATEAAKESGDHLRLGNCHMNLGTFFMERNFPTGAIEEFQLALKEFALDENHQKIFITRQNLILVYLSIKNYQSAKKYVDKCRETVHHFKGQRPEAMHYKALASYYNRKSTKDSSMYYDMQAGNAFYALNLTCDACDHYYRFLVKSTETYREIDQGLLNRVRKMDSSCAENRVYSNQLMLGKILTNQGKYQEAEELLTGAVKFFEDGGYTDYLRSTHDALSDLYRAKGDYFKALEHAESVAFYQDSLYSSERESEINFLELQYEEAKNRALQQNVKANEALITSQNESLTGQRKLNLTLGLVAALVLIIAVMGFITRLRLMRQNQALEKINEEVRKQRDIIAEKNDTLTENARQQANLMNVVAHDLSSPLRGILGLSELMLEEPENGDETRENLGVIREAAKNGIALTNEMLQAGSFNESKEKTLEPIELGKVLDIPLELNAQAARRKNVVVHKELDPSLKVRSHKDSLQRVVDNVLSNAIKFSPMGKNVWIRTQKENGHITISIKDEGLGFSDNDKKLIFKPFQKLSARPTNNENSTGLGLSIVKKLVDEIDGHIELISEQGKGAEFKIYVPAV